jgi:hypothetical protein
MKSLLFCYLLFVNVISFAQNDNHYLYQYKMSTQFLELKRTSPFTIRLIQTLSMSLIKIFITNLPFQKILWNPLDSFMLIRKV